MEILGASLLGGVLGLDSTSVGQFMVSRPLVAGLLAGWMLGDPSLGAAIGALLELYLLVSFPTGGARFPDAATATVVTVAIAAVFDGWGAVPLALAAGLVWGQLGGGTITLQRRVNARVLEGPTRGRPVPVRVSLTHLGGVTSDFLRGTVLTLFGIVGGRLVVGPLHARWPLDAGASTGLLLVGGAVSAGILLRDLGGFRRRRAWFAAGLALGVAGMRLL